MSDIALRVTRGNPSEEELAAVIAVISEAAAQEVEQAKATEPAAPDRWVRSKRFRTFPRDRWS